MLEQIKEELADKWVFDINGMRWSNNNNECGDNFESFKKGFDACMNLELSIKFAEWCASNCQPVFPNNNQWTINKNNSVKLDTKKLFNHFLNNVYGK